MMHRGVGVPVPGLGPHPGKDALYQLLYDGEDPPIPRVPIRSAGSNVEEGFPHQEAPPERNLIIGSRHCGADRTPTSRISCVPLGLMLEKR